MDRTRRTRHFDHTALRDAYIDVALDVGQGAPYRIPDNADRLTVEYMGRVAARRDYLAGLQALFQVGDLGLLSEQRDWSSRGFLMSSNSTN